MAGKGGAPRAPSFRDMNLDFGLMGGGRRWGKEGVGGGGKGGHNETSIIRDRSSMGKCISMLIQSSFNMNKGHITWEALNKGFQSEMKREPKGVLWGGVVLKTLYDNFRVYKH